MVSQRVSVVIDGPVAMPCAWLLPGILGIEAGLSSLPYSAIVGRIHVALRVGAIHSLWVAPCAELN